MEQTSLDTTLMALADPARRGVIDLLKEKPMKASEIASALALSRPAMSRHLRILRKSGLVEEEGVDDDARVRVYRLCREPFTQLHTWLDQVEAFWSEELLAFKQYVENVDHSRKPTK